MRNLQPALLAPLALFTLLLASACASSGMDAGEAANRAVDQTSSGLGDAALSPLEDLNLRRDPIPPELEQLETPYGALTAESCAAIARDVQELTALLGPDDDLPPADDEAEEDRARWAADRSSEAALDAVASQARSVIPFRSLVRDATGASAHARKLANAYRLGMERRAYLKGYGQALGCSWPAAPLPPGPEESRIIFR